MKIFESLVQKGVIALNRMRAAQQLTPTLTWLIGGEPPKEPFWVSPCSDVGNGETLASQFVQVVGFPNKAEVQV